MGILSWIIIGALAGWIASMITGKNREMGAGSNILVGIIGAFIGGFIMNYFGRTGYTGFNLWSFLVALGGSVILLLILNLFNWGARNKGDDFMRAKPDDRRDNVDRIQHNIDKTVHNMEVAEDMIATTDNQEMKQDLEAKNERRRDALDGMRQEIKEEADARDNDYKD